MRSATNSTLKSFGIDVVNDYSNFDHIITSDWLAIPDNCNEQEGEEGEDATKADTDQGETNCQNQPPNLEIIWVIVEDDEIEER